MLEAFANVKAAGAGWTATCPGHEDRRASLSIGKGDGGRWLLKCHAGCSVETILSAANLTTSDLFPSDRRPNGSSAIVAEYSYLDEQRQLLYQVVRFAPKDFRQRRPNGSGGWTWNLNSTRRVPYRLPELRDCETVIVVEGEKDADRLWALGMPATTNAGGAGKWCAAYADLLKRSGCRHVVVLPDNDPPGETHGTDVATNCLDAGLDVKVIRLPGLELKGDVSDWLERHSKDELVQVIAAAASLARQSVAPAVCLPGSRTLHVTRASDIAPRPVRWIWDLRLAFGTLNLLGGREGIGKSIFGCWLVAAITRGRLPGAYEGHPRGVIIAATEDSWAHTIVPRLMAAGADLHRVVRVDVETADGADAALSLPRDLPAIEQLILAEGVAALLLDPILSRLDAGLDSHKDGEVRQALEPLVSVLDRTGCMGLGLIHVNKSTSNDPLTTLMASRAFAAVARAVLFVMVDPDDEQSRLLGQPKNNLGRSDLPTLAFTIDGAKVAETVEGPVWTGQLRWTGESDRSIRDALQQAAEVQGGNRTAVTEAGEWLQDYLSSKGGSADSADVKAAGIKAGHTKDAIHRARLRLKIATISVGFPRRTAWMLSSAQSLDGSGETSTTQTTQTTDANHGLQLLQLPESSESFDTPRARDDRRSDVGHF